MCGRVEALPCGGRCKDAAVRVSGRWCSTNVGGNGRGRQRSILTSRSDQPLEHGAERRRGSLPSSFSWNLLLLLSLPFSSFHLHHQSIRQSFIFFLLYYLSFTPYFQSPSFQSPSFPLFVLFYAPTSFPIHLNYFPIFSTPLYPSFSCPTHPNSFTIFPYFFSYFPLLLLSSVVALILFLFLFLPSSSTFLLSH